MNLLDLLNPQEGRRDTANDGTMAGRKRSLPSNASESPAKKQRTPPYVAGRTGSHTPAASESPMQGHKRPPPIDAPDSPARKQWTPPSTLVRADSGHLSHQARSQSVSSPTVAVRTPPLAGPNGNLASTQTVTPTARHHPLPARPQAAVSPSEPKARSAVGGARTEMKGRPLQGEDPNARPVRRDAPPAWARTFTQAWHRENAGKTKPFRIRGKDWLREIEEIEIGGGASDDGNSVPEPVQKAPKMPVNIPLMTRSDQGLRPEASYTTVEPNDELVRVIADFLHQELVQTGLLDNPGPNTEVEIEAKVGKIINKGLDQRISLPVMTETVVNPAMANVGFRSSMTLNQHRFMNDHLNKEAAQSLHPDPATGLPRQRISYKHLRETDRFFKAPPGFFSAFPEHVRATVAANRGKPRVRTTTDKATGKITNKMVKTRVKDLHVYCPKSDFDWRISISLESQWEGNPANLDEDDDAGDARDGRAKDRLSYEHQGVRIDLTQVTMGPRLEHELEFELPVDQLRAETAKLLHAEQSDYLGLILNFVNDVRIATRQFPI